PSKENFAPARRSPRRRRRIHPVRSADGERGGEQVRIAGLWLLGQTARMKRFPGFLVPVLAVACMAVTLCAAETNELKLWPREVPGGTNFKPYSSSKKKTKDDGTTRLALVTEPTITLFRAPADKANGAAVVVCPGGGYNILAWDKEGVEVAAWLN